MEPIIGAEDAGLKCRLYDGVPALQDFTGSVHYTKFCPGRFRK